MRPSDYLADTIAGEQKRWAALAGLNEPLPQPAKNGKFWGSIAMHLCLVAMMIAILVGLRFVRMSVLYGLVIMVGRTWVMVYLKLARWDG